MAGGNSLAFPAALPCRTQAGYEEKQWRRDPCLFERYPPCADHGRGAPPLPLFVLSGSGGSSATDLGAWDPRVRAGHRQRVRRSRARRAEFSTPGT